MRNKLKWYPILLVFGLVLLLASSAVACGQSYTQEDLEKARQTGYNAGFTEGYKAGLAQSGAETVTPPSTTPEPSAKTEPSPTPKADLPAGAISWDKAKDHIGERTTVYGPVIGATYASSTKGQPTFLSVGKNYPDPARFTVLIWGTDRSKFSPAPEIQYKGRTIYVYGLIELYQGSAEIIVTSPSQIQVQ